MIATKYELREIDQSFIRGDTIISFKDSPEQRIDDEIFNIDDLLKKIFPKGKKILMCYWKHAENPYSAWRLVGFAVVKKFEEGTGRPIKYGKVYTLLGAGLPLPGIQEQIIGLKDKTN